MQKSLEDIQKDFNETLYRSRKQAIDRHNFETHMTHYKAVVGDYVVVARTHGPQTKISTNWIGLRRVSRIPLEVTVELENLLTASNKTTHVWRIKPDEDKIVGSAVQMRESAEFSDRIWYSYDKIKDIRENSNQFEVFVSWKGLSIAGESFEPL